MSEVEEGKIDFMSVSDVDYKEPDQQIQFRVSAHFLSRELR